MYICLDIQKLEVYSTRDYSTPNWTKYHNTTCSSNKVQLNPNYVTIVKQAINKLLIAGFIKPVEEAIKLSPIVVVPKKNGKLKIYVDFRKFNVATKKDLYLLFFIDKVINIIARHKVYTFLVGFLGYHQISIALED